MNHLIEVDKDNAEHVLLGTGFTDGSVSVRGGAVYFVEGGSAKQTLILIHGFSQDWYEFHRFMELAAKEYKVIAIDLPGIGRSTTTDDVYDAESIAEVVREFCQQRAISKPYIVGHDMGGMVAYAYARLYPQDVAGIAVLDAPLPGTPSTDVTVKLPFLWHFTLHRLPFLPEKIIHGREHGYFKHAFFTRFMRHKNAMTPLEMQHYASAYKDIGQLKAGLGLYRAYRADRRFTRRHRTPLHVPILVLESDYGSTKPGPVAKQLKEKFGCQSVDAAVIAGCGHYMAEEAPEEVYDAITRHVASSTGALLV